MSTWRERYGNGPVSWPFWARVALTAAVLAVPMLMLVSVVLVAGDPDPRIAAFYLLIGGMCLVFSWPVLRWTWTPTDESLIREWQVERAFRRMRDTVEDDEEAPPFGIHDRTAPPRW